MNEQQQVIDIKDVLAELDSWELLADQLEVRCSETRKRLIQMVHPYAKAKKALSKREQKKAEEEK